MDEIDEFGLIMKKLSRCDRDKILMENRISPEARAEAVSRGFRIFRDVN